jgi:hypothetical protein
MPSTHRFSADPQAPLFCRCGLPRDVPDHEGPADAEASPAPPNTSRIDKLLADPVTPGELFKRIEALLAAVGEFGKCRGCEAPIYWVMTKRGAPAPYTPQGLSHFADCPAREQFRKR